MGIENELTIKRFIEIRRDLGYTQAEFASILGIPNTCLLYTSDAADDLVSV